MLYYERALKLDPSYSDARFNLEFVNSLLKDKIDEVPEFFMLSLMRGFCRKLSSDQWAVLALVFAAGLFAMLLLFLLGTSSSRRKTGFFCGLVFAFIEQCIYAI